MNDDVGNLNQNTLSVNQAVRAQPQPSQAPLQSVVPASSPNKETGPISTSVSEFVKPTETEPQISQELKDIGIEAKKDAPDATDEHKGVIEHAKQFTPVSASPPGKVTMPMSEEEIADKLKTGRDDDSGKWLAGLIGKIIRAMGLSNER
ncbi:MAG: hypothetical protein A3C22_02670 [Candidatus Levybacteria bacterium RIFCSPHIGHO2_02_FULL_37_10]|uniref:Uncharacterized protein n=1 Tax=Candidatus Portnoybacteria bacterium RIFCSPHIGHO2_01_FULL_40_12b TaxID=1801994 RepID=A0A1G2FCY0_9BACT|nr:MAG: hypothetical protein A3C22_02670 [Candidatus Levybacteria bacterium RIFCSPHIGHO2_02_FULL_37_10]OGH42407.1 MAG: hypothetical protein A3H79_02865 [Candidatus Levybacteria bacterium RIFCSPLOWO2_02_FULL_36_8b]OGZ35934.1 MAG: hypothetical protein A2815_01350 [Candidatus Portnoybacteria bacterium RIFCSPHIGHO2_01_FULL_40_12b]